MPGPGRLGAVARQQLAAWQQVAADWPVRVGGGASHLHCGDCGGPVLAIADGTATAYHLTPQQIMDATVMHLRARHEDLDPDR